MIGFNDSPNTGPQITTTQNPPKNTNQVVTRSERQKENKETESYTSGFWETLEEHGDKITIVSQVAVLVTLAYDITKR